MKTNFALLSLILLVLISSCTSSEDDGIVIEPTTSLEITLKDNLGNNLQDVVVKLFSSQDDWENQTNQVGSTKYSDASGVVRFNDLSNIKYYWYAEKGCANNIYGSITTVSPIEKTKVTTVTSILEKTGFISLKSTSNNPYRIYINGTILTEMNGNESKNFTAKEGAYTVRVLQLSGYILYPTDKTYNITVGCGQTISVTFP